MDVQSERSHKMNSIVLYGTSDIDECVLPKHILNEMKQNFYLATKAVLPKDLIRYMYNTYIANNKYKIELVFKGPILSQQHHYFTTYSVLCKLNDYYLSPKSDLMIKTGLLYCAGCDGGARFGITDTYSLVLKLDSYNLLHAKLMYNIHRIEEMAKDYVNFHNKRNGTFRSCIKDSSIPNSSHKWLNIKLKGTSHITKFYRDDKSIMTFSEFKDSVVKGDSVGVILKVHSIWSSHGNMFGLKLVPKIIRLRKSIENMLQSDYLFSASDSE